MAFSWFNSRYEMEKIGEYTADYTFNAFQTGQQFPPYNHRERISKYKRLKKAISRQAVRSIRAGDEIIKGFAFRRSVAAVIYCGQLGGHPRHEAGRLASGRASVI